MKLSKLFSEISLLIAGIALASVIGVIDHLTGRETSLSLMYLIPVFAITYLGEAFTGAITAIYAGLIWTIESPPDIPVLLKGASFYWNAFGNISIFIAFVAVITIMKREHEKIKEDAHTDFITGIPNIKTFYEHSEIEIARLSRYKRPISIAYLDCDNFKNINDTLGHKTGSQLLRAIAQTLKANIRTIDTIARIGGDEFAVLLPETGQEGAKIVIERLREATAGISKGYMSMTFSMGVITFLRPPMSVEEMLKRSDALMYFAKRTGKNKVLYEIVS